MATPTVVNSAVSFTSTVTIPSGATSGDLLIVFACNNNAGGGAVFARATTPTGWTRMSSLGCDSCYYKVSDGTESGTSLDFGTGTNYMNGMYVLRGQSTTLPIVGVSETVQGTGSTTRTGAATGSVGQINTLALFLIANSINSAMSAYSGGSISWTEDQDSVSGTVSNVALAHGTFATAGALTVSATSTLTTPQSRIVTLVIKDAQTSSTLETLTLTETITNIRAAIYSLTETLSLSEIGATLVRGFSNVAKSISAWINTNKS